jgi:hypothetical protein
MCKIKVWEKYSQILKQNKKPCNIFIKFSKILASIIFGRIKSRIKYPVLNSNFISLKLSGKLITGKLAFIQ